MSSLNSIREELLNASAELGKMLDELQEFVWSNEATPLDLVPLRSKIVSGSDEVTRLIRRYVDELNPGLIDRSLPSG